MLNIPLLLFDGAVLSVLLGTIVVVSFMTRPRAWLNDFPPDIARSTEPMTVEEKRRAVRVGSSVVLILIAGLVTTSLRFGFASGFWPALLHAYLVFQVFNVADLVIDWVALALIDPAKPPIPGTENAPGWSNYSFHAVKGLKGSVIGIPVVALATGIGWLCANYLM